MSQKIVPQRRGGIPLDELLATHSAGDAALDDFHPGHGGVVAPPSVQKSSKRRKTTASKAPGARSGRQVGSQIIEAGPPRLVGYARVSTDEQTTALQFDALRSAGCGVIHEDSASGASRSRLGLGRALEDLVAGDTLVVWKLDRLGRSLRDLLDIAKTLQKRDIALRSLTDHIDTGTAAGRMLYDVLGAVAQFEHDVRRERTVAGMEAAKRRGEHIGRPPALTPAQVRKAKRMLHRGESPNHVARVLRCGRSTLYRAIG